MLQNLGDLTNWDPTKGYTPTVQNKSFVKQIFGGKKGVSKTRIEAHSTCSEVIVLQHAGFTERLSHACIQPSMHRLAESSGGLWAGCMRSYHKGWFVSVCLSAPADQD